MNNAKLIQYVVLENATIMHLTTITLKSERKLNYANLMIQLPRMKYGIKCCITGGDTKDPKRVVVSLPEITLGHNEPRY